MYRRGNEDPAGLDQDDAIRYRLLVHNVMLALSNSISQSSVAGLSVSRSHFELSTTSRVLGSAGARWFWDTHRHEFEDSVQAIVNDLYVGLYDEEPRKRL